MTDTPMTLVCNVSRSINGNILNYRASCWKDNSYIYFFFYKYIYRFDLTTHEYDTYINSYDDSAVTVYPYLLFKYRNYIYAFSSDGTHNNPNIPYYYDENGQDSKLWHYPGQFSLLWGASTNSICIETGKRIILYSLGNRYAMYFDYTNAGSFEPNSIIVECSNQQINEAQIVNSDAVNATINVEQVYYSDGTTVLRIPGQVRITGGEWTTIE